VEATAPGPRRGARLVVEKGSLSVRALSGSDGSGTIFVTPLTEIAAVEGSARLTVGADRTRVDVTSGRLEITRLVDHQRITVEARQSAVILETGAVQAVELPQALFIQGVDPGRDGTLDRRLALHIEAAGLLVVPVLEAELQDEDLVGKALVVISSSSSGAVLVERLSHVDLRGAAVPIVTCENTTFPALGMTANLRSASGAAANITDALVEQPGHALAAGYSGTIQLATAPVRAAWGQPGKAALRIASLPNHRRVAVFAYDRGTPMFGLEAPARRASCFLEPDTASLTDAGWKLFEAAVRWAAQP
jgi:hypothetical protein